MIFNSLTLRVRPPPGRKVSFQWMNPDFLLRNPDFLLRNPDFLLKNVDFTIECRHSLADRGMGSDPADAGVCQVVICI